MPETLRSISIFAFVLNEHGQPVQAWETVSDGSEIDAIKEAKSIARAYAGVLVARRDGIPAIGQEGDPVIIYRTGKTDGFD